MGVQEANSFLAGETPTGSGGGTVRSLQAASAQNPDDYARRLQLSKQSNIPAAWIPEFKDEAAHRAIAADPLVQNLHETHPATAEYFSRKDNAAVSQDDMKAMARMEKLAKEGFGKQEPISTLTSGNFFSQETRDEAHKAVSGFIPRLAQKWGGLQLYAGEMLQKEYPFVYGANGYGADLAERGRALLVGSHDDLAATHSENEAVKLIQGIVDMAPAMALAPFTGGLSVIADAGLGSMGGKYAANRMAGKDTDDSQASAVASGALNAAAMLIPMKHLLKPGYSLFKRTMITTLATTLGMDVAEVGTLITDKASVNPEMTLLEAASDLLETTGMGLAQGFAMAPISHPMEKLHERVTGIKRGPNAVDPVAKAERHAATLEQMGATVQESKTNGRAPDKVAEHIAAIKKAHGGQVDNAYVPVEAWNTLFQNAGMDPAQVAESVLSDPRRYSEALHTGSDIAIPLEEFVTGLSGMEQYKDLVQNTRMGQGDLTPVEAKEFKATERERFTAALNEVDSAHQAGSPARKVYADVKRQLVEAGGDPQNAHQEAAIVMASFRALEKIHPTMDAWELYQQHGLGIKQEGVNADQQKSVGVVAGGDPGGLVSEPAYISRFKASTPEQQRDTIERYKSRLAEAKKELAPYIDGTYQDLGEEDIANRDERQKHHDIENQIVAAMEKAMEGKRDSEQGKTPEETQAGQLRPAVVIDGKTIVGEVGSDHKATREAHGHENGEGDAGFVAADGKFMTREEAKAWVEQNQPEAFKHLPKGEMHSKPYAEAVAKAGKAGEEQTLYQSMLPPGEAPTPERIAEAKRQHDAVNVLKDDQGRLVTEDGKLSALNEHQYRQVRTPMFKEWFGDWEEAEVSRFMKGEPVKELTGEEAPHAGFAALRDWATALLTSAPYNGVARNPVLGEVVIDGQSVRSSMGHGMNHYKAVAFASVPEVIRRGRIIRHEVAGGEDSFYISAPVRIAGVDDIVTVLIHRDVNKQRFYLHSITTKENLLNSGQSGADAGASKRSKTISSEGNASILRGLLTVNPDSVSKVVNPETGEPIPLYHQTSKANAQGIYEVHPQNLWEASGTGRAPSV